MFRCIGVAVVLQLIGLVVASPQVLLQETSDTAVNLFQSGRFADALNAFIEVKMLIPKGQHIIEVDLNIALCYQNLGDNLKAAKHLHFLEQEFPHNEKVLYSLCKFYSQVVVEPTLSGKYCRKMEETQQLHSSCKQFEVVCHFNKSLEHCYQDVSRNTREPEKFARVYDLGRMQMLANRPKDAFRSWVQAWNLYLLGPLLERTKCRNGIINLHLGWMVDPKIEQKGDVLNSHHVLWSSKSDPRILPQDQCFADVVTVTLESSPQNSWFPNRNFFRIASQANSEARKEVAPIDCFLQLKSCELKFNSFVFKLHNAYIEIPGIIYTECDLYLGGQHAHSHVPLIRPESTISPAPVAAVLLNYKMVNWYHWLVEGLSKLIMLKEHVLDIHPEIPLMIPHSSIVEQFVDILQIPKERLVFFSGDVSNVRYYFDELYYADWDTPNQEYRRCDLFSGFYGPPYAIRKSSKIFSGSPLPVESRNLIIYITRNEDADAGHRGVVDEGKLLRFLNSTIVQKLSYLKQQYKLMVAKTSDMTVLEQIELFKQAAVIMGPHGAGLSNMMWAAKGSVVIEFPISPNYNVCFGNLARVLGHKYWVIPELKGCYYGKYQLSKTGLIRLAGTLRSALNDYESEIYDFKEHDEL